VSCAWKCINIGTFEKFYYQNEDTFVKRNLRPAEYKIAYTGEIYVPRMLKERLENEVATMKYIAEHTDIPLPRMRLAFEEDGAYFVATEKVPGVDMADLDGESKSVVMEEIQQHLRTLRDLRSNTPGAVTGVVLPPYRVSLKTKQDIWKLRKSETEEFVFCHNDLSQQNIIVDPDTLKINAILDWEYSGFYPEYFEGHFWTRWGPSGAIKDEVDDTDRLLLFLKGFRYHDGRDLAK
jgi:tRNA A-37 threonylcarbamoyl transferase component Bud32